MCICNLCECEHKFLFCKCVPLYTNTYVLTKLESNQQGVNSGLYVKSDRKKCYFILQLSVLLLLAIIIFFFHRKYERWHSAVANNSCRTLHFTRTNDNKTTKKKKKKALLYKRQAGKAQLHLLWNKLKSLLPSAQNFDKQFSILIRFL